VKGALTDWWVGLVFEASPGVFHEETWTYRGQLSAALALARRDGAAAGFGRRFVGFSTIAAAPASSREAPPRLRLQPQSPARPVGELLAPFSLTDDALTAGESPRHPARLEGLSEVRWWEHEGALGPATALGVALGRCASVDAEEAAAAGLTVAQSVISNRHLFPAAEPAIPFVVELVAAPEVSCRAALAACLAGVIDSAFEANDTGSNLMALAARVVAPHLAADMASHQAGARAVGLALARHKPRLEALADDAEVGAQLRSQLSRVP
jgi:hypothetical protein